MAGTMRPEPTAEARVSKVDDLKEALQELADAPLYNKAASAEKVVREMIVILEEHGERIDKLESYIRGQHAE